MGSLRSVLFVFFQGGLAENKGKRIRTLVEKVSEGTFKGYEKAHRLEEEIVVKETLCWQNNSGCEELAFMGAKFTTVFQSGRKSKLLIASLVGHV